MREEKGLVERQEGGYEEVGEEEEVVSKGNVVCVGIWTLKWQWVVGESEEIV